MMNKREYYRVDFKENEFGLWVCGDEEETYESAKNTYTYKINHFKGAQLVKCSEEVLEEYESEIPFLRGDHVVIIKDCSLKGQKGRITDFDLCNNMIVVTIDENIKFYGTFEDIEKQIEG